MKLYGITDGKGIVTTENEKKQKYRNDHSLSITLVKTIIF